MRPTHRILGLATLSLLALAACGDPETQTPAAPAATNPPATSPADPTSPGNSDPEAPVEEPAGDAPIVEPGALDVAAALRNAASFLGTPEADLPSDARIGARGDEQLPLTTDFVPGRATLTLADDGTGTFVVVEVTVELEDRVQVVNADTLLESAASILGTPETGVDPSWRVGRRGEESFALTEDFVVGRFTVELDDDGTGVFLISSVTVELPGRVEVVSADTLRERASALIGTPESDLSDDARLARRGDE